MVMTSQNRIPLRADFVKSLRMLPDLSNDQLKQIASNTNDPLSTFAIAVLNSKQISANSSQNANQPTIANQVLAKENASSGLASLAQSPTMLASANMQPAATAEQAGVSSLPIRDDMFNEKNYANGGIVAFDEGGKVKNFVEGGPSVASLKYQAALADSYLDPKYLVSGAQDVVSRGLFGYRVVRDPVTGEIIQAKNLPSSVDALKKKKKSEAEELLDKAEKVKEERQSAISRKENLTELDPTIAAATFDKTALYKDPNMSELYNMAKPRVQAFPEKGNMPPNATQQFNPYNTVEKPRSTVNTAEDTARRFQEMMGADPEREDLRKKVQELELGSKEQERMAPWLSLAKAGFGIAAGKSPFALQNIGEGAQLGISEYVAARDRLDKLNERRIDIRSKLNQVERAEKAAGVSAGLSRELKEMEESNANARNAATNQVQLKVAAMAAAKKSDYETYLSIAQQDPDNYKFVKNPETGETTKVFDAPKVTQAYKSFSGSSGLDDDKLFAAYQQEKMMDKNFNLSFQDYKNQIRGTSGSTAPTAIPSGVKVTRTQ